MIRLKIRIESSRNTGQMDGPCMELSQESKSWAPIAKSVEVFIVECARIQATYIFETTREESPNGT